MGEQVISQKARVVDPVLVKCWSTVGDAGPTLGERIVFAGGKRSRGGGGVLPLLGVGPLGMCRWTGCFFELSALAPALTCFFLLISYHPNSITVF